MTYKFIELTEDEIKQAKKINKKVMTIIVSDLKGKSGFKSFSIYSLVIRSMLHHWLTAIKSDNALKDRCMTIRAICDVIEEEIKQDFLDELEEKIKKSKDDGRDK